MSESVTCGALHVPGGLSAGVADGQEGGGAGGADGLVEDDVRDTELLKRLPGPVVGPSAHRCNIFNILCTHSL